MGKTLDDLRKEGLVSVGPALIQTAEDARVQYLRGVIDEDQLNEILAYHGVSAEPTSLTLHPNSFDRLDDAFERSLPDVADVRRDTLEDRQKRLEVKEDAREAASKAGPDMGDVKAENSVKVVVDPNAKAREAYEETLAKGLTKVEDSKEKRVQAELKQEAKDFKLENKPTTPSK